MYYPLVCVLILGALLQAPCFAGGSREKNQANGTPPSKEAQVQSPAQEQFPPQRVLVFIGVAGRLSNREEAIQAALRDAARRLSFFYGVSGLVVKQEHIGSQTMDIDHSSEYQLRYDEELDKYIDELEFDPAADVFEHNNAVFVVTRWSSELPMPSSSQGYSSSKKRPAWVDKPPQEIGGFISGVGHASRLSSHKDMVIASYEDAVVEIIESLDLSVQGSLLSYQNSYSAFNSDQVTDTRTSAQGALQNFYIVETWTDTKDKSVWTLAVARKKGS